MNEHYPRSPAEIRRHFEFFDDDKNGYIDFAEYRDMLKLMGQKVSTEEAAESFSTIDTDCDGQVSFEEFVAWWQSLWYDT